MRQEGTVGRSAVPDARGPLNLTPVAFRLKSSGRFSRKPRAQQAGYCSQPNEVDTIVVSGGSWGRQGTAIFENFG
jgi:hypothetical protein